MSNFTNSPMVNVTFNVPHRNSPRNAEITAITLHHFASTATVDNIGGWFMQAAARASYNYGVGNRRTAMYVEERNRSWASSNAANDHRAITIGVQNSARGNPWPIADSDELHLIQLCIDICRRNPGIRQENGTRGLWYNGTSRGSLTRHNMFANTDCPGRDLGGRFQNIVRQVNAVLDAEFNQNQPVTPQPPTPPNTWTIGQIVQFAGGPHFVGSTVATPSGERRAGRAQITALAPGARNSIHLVGSLGNAGGNNSNVHGWVDANLVTSLEPVAPPQPPQPPAPPRPPVLSVGDIVTFKGGPHFGNSLSATPSGTTRSVGRARVTALANGRRNPVHLVGSQGGSGSGNSNVHGWVTLDRIDGATPPPPRVIAAGSHVRIQPGSTWFTGLGIPASIMTDTWVVLSRNGDRVVLNTNVTGTRTGIMSPIHVNRLTLI